MTKILLSVRALFSLSSISRSAERRLPIMNNDKSKQSLMREIQVYSFAVKDIHLYLDTHPNCIHALAYFHKYNDMFKNALAEYNRLYGPVNVEQVSSNSEWTWVKSPWPWERSGS